MQTMPSTQRYDTPHPDHHDGRPRPRARRHSTGNGVSKSYRGREDYPRSGRDRDRRCRAGHRDPINRKLASRDDDSDESGSDSYRRSRGAHHNHRDGPKRRRRVSFDESADPSRLHCRSPASTKSSAAIGDKSLKMRQAATSALTAGAVEALRVRKRPGKWVGSKGAKVVTAAMGAAVVEESVNADPDRNPIKKVAGGTVGGLLASQLVKGLR